MGKQPLTILLPGFQCSFPPLDYAVAAAGSVTVPSHIPCHLGSSFLGDT